jgi:uncharacterized protein (TIGR02453 family)
MPVLPTTMKFLKDLERNNNRDWFLDHKAQYENATGNMKDVLQEVISGLRKKDVIEDGKLFRIYRDVRFSKDKAPYKNHYGIHFVRAGKERRGGYYLHIQPGESLVGGGFWAPSPEDLKRMRDEFAYDDKPIRKILASKSFISNFGKLEGDELKTAPSGFERDSPAIDLIRKKQYLLSRKFKDKEVLDPGFVKEVVKTFEAMRPYFDYMSEVLTTNSDGEKK